VDMRQERDMSWYQGGVCGSAKTVLLGRILPLRLPGIQVPQAVGR
jgi:hypothetical protein